MNKPVKGLCFICLKSDVEIDFKYKYPTCYKCSELIESEEKLH